MKDKKGILVFGARGFFGRAVVKALTRESNFEVKSCSREEFDITNLKDIKRGFEEFSPQVLVNCSGITGNVNCVKNPKLAYDVNVVGVENLVSECKKRGVLLVHPSSVVVFSGSKSGYKESDQPKPQKGNVYAETKYESEKVVQSSGVDFIIPRLSTGYGPICPGDTTNFVGIVVGALERGEVKGYFHDQFANPVEIGDVGEAIVQLIKVNFKGIVHIGGPEIVSMFEFAKIIKEEYGLSGKIDKLTVVKTNYPPNITLDVSLAQSLGLHCKNIRAGVRYCRVFELKKN